MSLRAPEHALAVGRRAFIRRPAERDEDAFLQLVRNSVALHRPWVFPPNTSQRFQQYLQRGRAYDCEQYLVCRVDDEQIAGVINLNEIVRGNLLSASTGYYAFASSVGEGYMSDGVRLVLDQAFHRHGLHRVEACIQPGNDASRKLVERIGFRYEGFSPRLIRIAGDWRDHERFAILAEEWNQPRSPGTTS